MNIYNICDINCAVDNISCIARNKYDTKNLNN